MTHKIKYKPEDQWSCKRSPDYFPGITTTVKREKRATLIVLDAQEQQTLWSLIGSGKISNSSKLLCMSSLPASMKRLCSRIAEKKWQHHFPHFKPMGFSDPQEQLTPAEKKWQHRFSIITLSVAMETSGRIWPNFKLIQALMYVIV